jgi:Fe-S-cluster-containing dehydrogenase component
VTVARWRAWRTWQRRSFCTFCVCRHDDGIVGIGVEVSTAEVADFAKIAKMTAEIADFAKIAKISEGELRQVEQIAEIEPLVILRHGLVLRAHAVVAVADQRIDIAI